MVSQVPLGCSRCAWNSLVACFSYGDLELQQNESLQFTNTLWCCGNISVMTTSPPHSSTEQYSVDELLAQTTWMRRLSATLLNGADDAGDLAQDAMAVALEKPPNVSVPIQPWLASVVRNLARMRFRSSQRRATREQAFCAEGETGVVVSEAMQPDRLLERLQVQQMLAGKVARLAEPERSVLLLRYFEELSSAEIAEQLAMPASTVRWRLRKAIQQLRTELDDEHPGGSQQWALLLAPISLPSKTLALGTPSIVKGALLVHTAIKLGIAAVCILALYLSVNHLGWWNSGQNQNHVATPLGPSPTTSQDGATLAETAAISMALAGKPEQAMEHALDPVGSMRLEGQVIDQDFTPVANALVAINSNPRRVVETEDDGSFVLSDLPARDYWLEATDGQRHAGPVALSIRGATEPLILRLRDTQAVNVVVRSASGVPVPQASIAMRSLLEWTAESDAKGAATLAGIGPGVYTLRVSAKGFAASSTRYIVSDALATQLAEVVLQGAAMVSGRVVDSEGEPVEGARIQALRASEPFPLEDSRDAVVSDAKGEFRMHELAGETYRFVTRHSEFATSHSSGVVLHEGSEQRGIEIVLNADAVIRGQVLTPDRKPIGGADIRLRGLGNVPWRAVHRAYSDADGRFVLSNLPIQEAELLALNEVGASETTQVSVEPGEPTEIELIIEPGAAIAGHVVSSSGEPLPAARILVEPEWTEGLGARDAWALRGGQRQIAGAGGEFRVRGLPEGRYRLRAIAEHAPASQLERSEGVVLETGINDAKIVIPGDGSVVGRVLFADGSAPTVFTVAIVPGPATPFSSSDGEFALSALVGSHQLSVFGPEFAQTSMTVDIESKTNLGTITVKRGRSISGRVFDANGAPAEGVEVAAGKLLSGDGSKLFIAEESISARQTTTDALGRYSIAGLGEHAITIVAGLGASRSNSVRLPGGTESMQLDLKLESMASMSGTITKDGKPVAETIVIANPVGATSSNFFVVTASDGSFSFEQLSPGGYVVYPMLGGGGGRPKDMFSRFVDVALGQGNRTEIAITSGDATLAVRVVDAAKAPLASQVLVVGAEINLDVGIEGLLDGSWLQLFQDREEPVAMHMRTALLGKTTIEHIQSGTVSICAVPLVGDDERPLRCRSFVMQPGGSHEATIRIELPSDD